MPAWPTSPTSKKTCPAACRVKMWTRGVPVEDEAKRQLTNAARLPIVFKHIAAMPDVHFGIGATVGSVIPTLKAIIPAAVGVDIGCGMMACKTTLTRRRPARQPGAAALGDRARGAARPRAGRARPGRVEQGAGRGRHGVGAARAGVHRAVPRLPEAGEDQPPQPPGHAGHRQPLHRGLPRRGRASCGSCCTRARAASATPSARCSSSWPSRTRCATTPTCRTATWRTSRKARATSATTCAPSAGRRSSRALNREVMMQRVIEAAKTVIRKNFQSHVEAVNCHHNYVQKEAPLRRGRVRHAQGRGEREGRASWASSPAAWARAATSCAARATRSASRAARTAPAA